MPRRFSRDALRCLAVAALALALAFHGLAAAAQPAAGSAWAAFASDFVEGTFKARPNHAVWAGRHEFDGGLPDWSAAGLRKEIERLRTARKRALGFGDNALSAAQRFERDYIVAAIDDALFWLVTAEEPYRSPVFYAFALDPHVYIVRDYAPLAQRMKAYVAYAKAIPLAVEQVRGNLRTPLPRSFVRFGHISAGGLASFYENDVPALFASVDDPRLQDEFRAANAGAIRAMRELDAWFTQQEASATDAFALGSEKFAAMLRAVYGVDVPLARLKDIARRDLERNLAALRQACRALAPGSTVEACVAKVRADKGGETPIRVATRQLDELRSFLEASRLVTIPGPELPRVAESPPYMRWNSASISIPGPLEKKNLPSHYYIAPPDPKWTPAEQDAYVPGKDDLLFTSVHEVWPGHFLQFQHSNRSASVVGRVFGNYAFGEGWAHYTEEMMWEAGLGNGDPSAHVGQLLNALLRNVRLVSAIGLHTGGMTIAESEAMFREMAYQSPGNARQQADRGTFDPGYGAYTLGKLMIVKLRTDWTATRGGRKAWHAFHDRVLSYGAPPIPLLRKAMLGAASGPPL